MLNKQLITLNFYIQIYLKCSHIILWLRRENLIFFVIYKKTITYTVDSVFNSTFQGTVSNNIYRILNISWNFLRYRKWLSNCYAVSWQLYQKTGNLKINY